MFYIIKMRYIKHLITAEEVWAYTEGENPVLTEEQAAKICGPRP